jgi:hypothetical protein
VLALNLGDGADDGGLRNQYMSASLRIPLLSLSQSVRVRVTLRLTVSQSVCLGVEPRLGLMTRYLF